MPKHEEIRGVAQNYFYRDIVIADNYAFVYRCDIMLVLKIRFCVSTPESSVSYQSRVQLVLFLSADLCQQVALKHLATAILCLS